MPAHQSKMSEPRTAVHVLTDAAALISDPLKFTKDYSAQGWNPPEVARGEHLKNPPGSCLPSGDNVVRWNALGAIWRTALVEHDKVRAAHQAFVRVIGNDVSIWRWCAVHEQKAQVQALLDAADVLQCAEAL